MKRSRSKGPLSLGTPHYYDSHELKFPGSTKGAIIQRLVPSNGERFSLFSIIIVCSYSKHGNIYRHMYSDTAQISFTGRYQPGGHLHALRPGMQI